jgi:membrane protein
MTAKDLWELAKETVEAWNNDKAPRMGAAIAFYTVFSVAPVLIIVIAIAGLVFGQQAAQGRIVEEIASTIGAPAAEALQDLIKQINASGQSVPATIIGIVMLMFGATAVFVELQDALNTIWKVPPPKGWGIKEFILHRLVSFAIVVSTGFLLLVSLVISAGLAVLSKYLSAETLPGGAWLWWLVNSLISLGVITLLFALIYKVLPDVHIPWRSVWVGALVTAVLFTVGKYLLSLYLGQKGVADGFGAAGSLVVLLLWVYYSAQVVLLGAEFTRVYTQKFSGQPAAAGSESREVAHAH